MALLDSTSDQQVIGDGQGVALESFGECIHKDDNYDAEAEGYKGVYHRCRYADMYGRCIYDNCVFDQNEGPKVAHKHWIKCIFCGSSISLDPKLIDAPICDKCRAIFLQCCQLPFTCQCCGKSCNYPSKIYFSRICDDCLEKIYNSGKCKNHDPMDELDGFSDYDLP